MNKNKNNNIYINIYYIVETFYKGQKVISKVQILSDSPSILFPNYYLLIMNSCMNTGFYQIKKKMKLYF